MPAQTIAFGSGQIANVVLVDHTSHPLGVPLPKLARVMNKFLRKHFVPAWGTPAEVSVADELPDDAWGMVFVDDHTSSTNLGIHDITHAGLPLSRVFVNEVRRIGDSVSATACHELCEMLVDPAFNLCAEDADGTLYALEVSDPCEEDLFDIDGVAMSDFVYPSWFEHFRRPRSVQFDELGLIDRPFQLRPTGYISVRTNRAWRELHGTDEKKTKFATESRDGHRSAMRAARADIRTSITPAERGELRARLKGAADVGLLDRRHAARSSVPQDGAGHGA